MEGKHELLTAVEVANRLRVTPQTVYRWAAPGQALESAAVTIGGAVRFRAHIIDELIAAHTAVPFDLEPKAAS